MKKLLTLLLVAIMLVPSLVACSNDGDKTDETVALSTETGEEMDAVPELDFEGHEFAFATPTFQDWGAASYDQEEDSGDVVKSAIYKRNAQIETRFNITISAMDLGETGDTAAQFLPFSATGDDAIDVLCVGFYQSGGPLILKDLVLPWNDVDYIDLSRSWWNESVSQTLSICDNYYYIVGDVNWFTMTQTPVCYFNKNVQQEKQVEDLYQMVRDRKWTFDKCVSIAQSISNDVGSNGWNETDVYGAIQNNTIGVNGFLYGANIQTVVMTEDGPDLKFGTDTKLSTMATKIVSFCYDNYASYLDNFDSPDQSKGGVEIFFDNRALFYFDVLNHAKNFRDEESDFGIIPYPMYDENQANEVTIKDADGNDVPHGYVSYANQWGLACALPSTTLSENASRTGAILEAMCCLSRKEVVPAYYDLSLMGKYKRDDESEEMLDIIFANVLYDFGICYCTDLNYIPVQAMVYTGERNIASWYAKNRAGIEQNYQELYDHVKKKS